MKIESDSIRLDEFIREGIEILGINEMFKKPEPEKKKAPICAEILIKKKTNEKFNVADGDEYVNRDDAMKMLKVSYDQSYQIMRLLDITYFTKKTIEMLKCNPPINLPCFKPALEVDEKFLKSKMKGYLLYSPDKDSEIRAKIKANRITCTFAYGRKWVPINWREIAQLPKKNGRKK